MVSVFTAVFIIQVIVNPINILDYFVSYIVSFFHFHHSNCFWLDHIGFALAEYVSEGKLKKLNLDKGWKPSNLAPVPDPKRQIKRSEPIAGIIFYVLIIVFLAFSNDYFGIWIFQNGEFFGVVPFINETTYRSFLMLILIVFGFGIVKECLKFIYEKWTYSLVVFTTIVNLISIAVIMFLITGGQFWNPNFINELVQNGFLIEGSEAYSNIRVVWEQLTLWMLILLIFGLIWDIAAGFIKVRKASKQ